MKTEIEIKKLNENAIIPTYGTDFSAGADIYALIDGGSVTIAPGQTKMISTGLAFAIPEGLVGLIVARSSLGTKRGLAPANKVGAIDCAYRGADVSFAAYPDREGIIRHSAREVVSELVNNTL